jgi:putative salt-induced outer membrane protein YdiY
MRSFIYCAVALGCVLPGLQVAAQSGSGPAVAPPPVPATSSLPSPAAPSVPPSTSAPATPTATPTSSESASEPWKPPPGAPVTDGAAPNLFPEGELPAPNGDDSTGADSATKALIEEQSPWYTPQIWLGPAPWDSGVELGLNGSSGTNDSFSLRAGAYMKRESRFSKLDLDSNYNLTVGDGKESQNNAMLDLTNDWLLDEKSPWTLFAKANAFYDKFAAFDLQTNLNMGIGYRWVHTPVLDFMTRVGAGAEREFGGDDNTWVPESLAGAEYAQRISKTEKLYAKIEYFPQWEPFGEFRAVADAGWEIELVQPSNLSLKLSVSDRYDSTPDGTNPQLLNYSVLMLWKL